MKRKRRAFSVMGGAALALWSGQSIGAQSLPAVYAIVGARIEIGDGRVIEKGTVILRNGLIEAVGADVMAPSDAEILSGAGLTVYPGFIDAHATSGLKLPDPQPVQDVAPDLSATVPASMREANRKAIRPELRAADCLALEAKSLLTLRQNGFTSQMLAPTGGMMNGVGGLIQLSGRPRRECVVRATVASDFAFSTGGGGFGSGYPNSLLGVFAQMRQTLLDAQRYRLLKAAYEQGSNQRPPNDETLEALQPVLSGTMPALFNADSENEIHRALAFSQEFALRPVISGGLYAYKHAERLAERKVPALVSLNFGREPGEKPAPKPANSPEKPPEKPEENAELDTPKAALAERKRLWMERVGNAAKLNQAGVLFAFTTKGIRNLPDFWANLRRAIQAGLPREAALRALTQNSARILGVERQMGTVEAGKIASLTVMTGDFADAKSKVKYLFIDREKFEPEKDQAPSAPSGQTPRRQADEDDPHGK